MSKKLKIVMSGEMASFAFKEEIKKYVISLGHEVTDVGMTDADAPMSYVEAGENMVKAMREGVYDFGIATCGTGMGISQVINKYNGMYGALVESKFTARRSRIVNNSNILIMGGWVLTPQLGCEMVDEFFNTEFLEGETDPARRERLANLQKLLHDMGQK